MITEIKNHQDELALVLLPGIQYYTGQFLEVKAITKAAHEAGAYVGFDLAHAIGNVPLRLHEWKVDFAVWCNYKYINAGPGAVGGAFVHQDNFSENLPRLNGWWGQKESQRFEMGPEFTPMEGVDAWQQSNGNILSMAALRASLEIFEKAGIQQLRAKSILLTGYLEFLLKEEFNESLVRIITPTDHSQRGAQLSVSVKDGKRVYEGLKQQGIYLDWREPDVIRIAPTPLYNTFDEVYRFTEVLKKLIN